MPNPKYDEEFKKSIVSLVESGKSKTQVSRDYNVSLSAVSRWVKLYSEIRVDEETVFTAKQIKELQKRNAALEEENIILKKAIAIFTPHGKKQLMIFVLRLCCITLSDSFRRSLCIRMGVYISHRIKQ